MDIVVPLSWLRSRGNVIRAATANVPTEIHSVRYSGVTPISRATRCSRPLHAYRRGSTVPTKTGHSNDSKALKIEYRYKFKQLLMEFTPKHRNQHYHPSQLIILRVKTIRIPPIHHHPLGLTNPIIMPLQSMHHETRHARAQQNPHTTESANRTEL